jgi:hypothetical protein
VTTTLLNLDLLILMRQLNARLNPSSTDGGGTQPNKLHNFEISTCKLPNKRFTESPFPSNDAPACKAHTGTGSKRAGAEIFWTLEN